MARRTEEQMSEIMTRVKSRDTSPELAFRKALWACGVRYRLHDKTLPGKPDMIVRRARLAIFIDGDYWHGNQWRQRGHESLEAQFVSSPRADYWITKIGSNVLRDRRCTAALLKSGWKVLRLWESDIKKDIAACIDMTLHAIHGDTAPRWLGYVALQSAVIFDLHIPDLRQDLEKLGWSVDDSAPAGLAVITWKDGGAMSLSGPLGTMEEKPGIVLLDADGRQADDLSQQVRELDEMGYYCDMFALQERLYIVGCRSRSDCLPSEVKVSLARPRDVAEFVQKHTDLTWSLREVPAPPSDMASARQLMYWALEKYIAPLTTRLIHHRALSVQRAITADSAHIGVE